MSGPKCTEWSVAENLRLAALARQAALDDAKQLEGEIAVAQRLLEAVCARTGAAISATAAPVIRRPAAGAAIDEIRTYAAELRTAKAQLHGEAEQAESMARFSSAVAAAVQISEAAQRGKAVAAQERSHRSAAAAGEASKARAEELRRLLMRLPPSTSETDRLAAEALAQQVLSAESEGQGRGFEMELRARIQDIQAGEKARLNEARRAEGLLADLAGLDGAVVARVVDSLKLVAAGQGRIDARLEADVEAARVDAKARADREYAADVLREEFAALGYAIGDEFTTAFVQGGSILVSRADRSPHSIALHFDPHAATIDSEVVRRFQDATSETDSAARDAEAEQAWCSDFGKVLSGAWQRKVQARVVRRQPPGAGRVRVTKESGISSAVAGPDAKIATGKAKAGKAKHPRRRLQARQL